MLSILLTHSRCLEIQERMVQRSSPPHRRHHHLSPVALDTCLSGYVTAAPAHPPTLQPGRFSRGWALILVATCLNIDTA